MKKIILLFNALLLINNLNAQVNEFGYPLSKYYSPSEINSNGQNWAIARTDNGMIYIANNSNGILEYDGVSCRKISIEGNPEIRSIAINQSGLIFIGCSNEFGYLRPNFLGSYQYINLSKTLPDSLQKFSIIYKVNCINDTTYFSDDKWNLFKYIIPEDTLVSIKNPNHTLFTFKFQNELYGGSFVDGLFKIQNDLPVQIKGGDYFQSKNIFSVLNDSGKMIVVTGNQGLFNFDSTSGESHQILSSTAFAGIKNVTTYSAANNNDSYFLGTIGQGINVINSQGNLEAILDKQIGILDHICSSVETFGNNTWGTLGVGLTNIEYKNPIRYFDEESNLSGGINDIISYDDKLFVATDIGVFYLDIKNKKNHFEKIEGISNQVFSFCKLTDATNKKESLIFGTISGLFQLIDVDKPIIGIEKRLKGLDRLFTDKLSEDKLESATLYVYRIFSEEGSNKLWVGTLNRLFPIQYVDDEWYLENPILEIGDKIKTISDDGESGLWITTTRSGLFHFDSKTNHLDYKNSEFGIKENENLKVYKFKGKNIISTPEGIFNLSVSNNLLEPLEGFPNNFFAHSFVITNLATLSNGKIVVNVNNESLSEILVLQNNQGAYKFCDSYLKRLPLPQSEAFYEYKGRLWFSNANILYNIPIENSFEVDSVYKCLVRKVEGIDSVYFLGTFYNETPIGLVPSNDQLEIQKPILKFGLNDLTFHFAAPFFEGLDEIVYSYKLEGFKEETWSKWNKEPKNKYTNLYEGQYTFMVKAKNTYDVESTVGTYSFTILPPWYRTMVAYLGYVIIALLAVWYIVKLYTRKLKQEKIWLEGVVRERTAEIREQRDEIAEQKQSIEDSILYARRIQRAILPSKELADSVLPEYFILFRPRDIVSGDYYWINKIGHRTIVVAADCTGHGVPGAFMSMLGLSFLNEIILQENVVEAHLILNKLRERIKRTLRQEGKEGEAKDGMDVALIVIDEELKKLYFAGAYNPAYIYRGTELVEMKADRMPIGIYIKEKDSFTLNEYDYLPGDTFYIASDGYADQFGGAKKEKLKSKAMKEYLASIQDKPMEEQRELLNQHIEDWMGPDQEQIDDMVVIGVRMK